MIKSMTVTEILSFIETNLENKINMDVICNFTGYGRRYLQILFKKYIGMTLWQYIKYRKITRAALLLRLTSSKIIDISYRLQFDSQQSFSRDFKKIIGCTPLQYRKKNDWDLGPIFAPRTVDFKHPAPPEICFVDTGHVYGNEISYEQERMNTNKPFPLRWKIIDKYLSIDSSPLYLLSHFKIGKKNNDSIKVETIIGRNGDNPLHQDKLFKYYSGMYARITYSGSKEKYINEVSYLYLIVLPYYGLKRREGYDIEIITKDRSGYKCELFVPVVV
ncbi:helix-turn-helix domain-containing protein [Salmonella enterica subsp. enterica serovar Newport]|nr:helix-turn-helix domain-containing protein [Salmonella enterica subsp. enterica serovar Newport]EEN2684591.1 helix-turn-helix domain-containing protein [Salmonella enterica]EEN6708708.1 helix-turn-helix domain-containing protein [Salmonella enterica subsp. enterica serovar Rubislaw]